MCGFFAASDCWSLAQELGAEPVANISGQSMRERDKLSGLSLDVTRWVQCVKQSAVAVFTNGRFVVGRVGKVRRGRG